MYITLILTYLSSNSVLSDPERSRGAKFIWMTGFELDIMNVVKYKHGPEADRGIRKIAAQTRP